MLHRCFQMFTDVLGFSLFVPYMFSRCSQVVLMGHIPWWVCWVYWVSRSSGFGGSFESDWLGGSGGPFESCVSG